MAVFQRKNGSWVVVSTEQGSEKRIWKTFGKGLDAEKRAKEYHADLKQSGSLREYTYHPETLAIPTFYDIANEYIKSKSIELPKTSIKALWHKLTSIILPELGDIRSTQLTNDRIRDYIRKRLNSPVYKRTGNTSNGLHKTPVKNSDGSVKTISKSTVHRELSDIQAILNWAVSENYIPNNPIAGFKKPAREDAIIVPPTLEEIKAILSESPPHLQRALLISYYTGLRPGQSELFGLKWSDVNFFDKVIHIISAKKGGIKDRFIPLHSNFFILLIEWQKTDSRLECYSGDAFIVTWNHERVKSIKSAFKSAKRRAKITRRIRLYDFRHAFATTMLKAGGDLRATSEMLGHTRTDTTTRIYQHTDIDMYRNNINKMPNIELIDDTANK